VPKSEKVSSALVFAYQITWEAPWGDDPYKKHYGTFLLKESDPTIALPIILRYIEAEWGKAIRVDSFSGPNGGTCQYFIGGEANA
jgi:hypothetical protein